jgi:hypothetical protein
MMISDKQVELVADLTGHAETVRHFLRSLTAVNGEDDSLKKSSGKAWSPRSPTQHSLASINLHSSAPKEFQFCHNHDPIRRDQASIAGIKNIADHSVNMS